MAKSSFDARISQREFDKQITLTLAQNKSLSDSLKRDFTDRLDRETLLAKNKFGEKSPQYAQFLRSTLVFAERYTADMTNLDNAFDVLRAKAIESVGTEQVRVEKSTQAEFETPKTLFKADITLARAMNPVSIQKIFTGAEWEFQAYSPEERTRIGAKPFNMANAESWKETTFLLGAEFANSAKDIALFFTSIPGSIALLPRFAYLRANRHESMENEAMLAQMLKEFPALALVDLASDWDKAVMVLKEVASKMASGKQEDIAFAIVNVVGLLAGGALLAGKLGGSASKLARLASSGATRAAGKMAQVASTTTNAAVRAGARVAEIGAKWVAVGTLGVAGMATAGEVGLSRVARIAGWVDNVVSGQFAVNAAAGKVVKIAGGAQLGDTAGLTREGRMSKEESLRIARSNQGLDKADRVDGVEVLLNTKLTQKQADALEKAHNTQEPNSKGIGEFKLRELRAKARILQKEGGFTPEQTRAIMEHGYAGKMGDRIGSFIENGKLTFRRAAEAVTRIFAPERVPRSVDSTQNIRIWSDVKSPEWTIPNAKIAAAKANAEDVSYVDIPTKKQLTPETVKDATPETIADGVNVLEAEFVRTPNRSNTRIANLEKYEAAIKELQWKHDVDLQSLLDSRRKDLPKPKIREIEQGKRYDFVPASPVKMDDLSALLFQERGLQIILKDCAPGNTRYMADLLRTQTAIKDTAVKMLTNIWNKNLNDVKYQNFSQAFQNSNTLTYRISSVDGKPFVEIQNPVNKSWAPATVENTTAMRGQTLDNFNARIENEFKALLAKQKEATLANPSAESLQKSLDQVQRLLAKERGRLTPEIKTDIIDAVNGGAKSKNAQRIKDAGLNSTDLDKLIQDAAAAANKHTTVDQTRAALTEMTKNGKKNFLLADNINYEALRARMDKLSRDGLTALGEDPAKIAALTKTPEWRATLAKDLDAAKKNNISRWWLLLPLILALGWCASQNGDDKGGGSGGDSRTPVAPPAFNPAQPVGPQLEAACGVDSGAGSSELEDGRISDVGAKLTTKTRESISKRWMRSGEWTALVALFDESQSFLDKGFLTKFQAVQSNPNISNVQELQRWIGMASKDQKTGQDGILGPITTSDIAQLINACAAKKTLTPSAAPAPTGAAAIPGQTTKAPPSDGNNGTIPEGQPDVSTPVDPMGDSMPGV
jgi:hypothetical protein